MNKFVILRAIVFLFSFFVMFVDKGLERPDSDSRFYTQQLFPFLHYFPPSFFTLADCGEESNQIHSFYEPHDIFYLMEEQLITIASKAEEKVEKAPSIVTVITEEKIANMGFRTLTDVLRIVPGFDIIKSASFGDVEIGVRGLASSEEKVKILVDGHSLNMPITEDAILFFDDLTLRNVKRVEIIRGPGSALYGKSAFLAVINIITKDAADIDGIEVAGGFGSFDSQEYNILFGKNLYGIEIACLANFYNTNGLSDTIKEDFLSTLLFFNRFSITPGDTDDSRNKLDLYLKLIYKDIMLKAKYMNKDTEPFVSPAFILTNDADQQFNYAMGEISYKYELLDGLVFNSKLYYDQYDIELFEESLPKGFKIPVDRDGDGRVEEFPDGLLGHGLLTNRRLGSELQFDYDLFDNNVFTFGFNYEWERQDNLDIQTNLDRKTGVPLRTLKDLPETANFIQELTRQIWAIYVQNKWDITDDIGLTVGIRHDHYSDFEGTTNPRIGFVWNFMKNANLKLLYGQAFRAPSFLELFSTSNFLLEGNPNLKPETIRTYEIGLDYKFSERFNTNINYFFNVIRDQIGFERTSLGRGGRRIDNLGGSNIQGIEFEFKADLSHILKGTHAFVNYTYLDAESNGESLPDVPKHKGNVGFNVEFGRHLNANINAFISDKRARSENDHRDDSPGYAIVDLTLIAKEIFKGLEIKASLFNLLDKDYNDPSPANTIPTDLPRPGRTFFLEFGYGF